MLVVRFSIRSLMSAPSRLLELSIEHYTSRKMHDLELDTQLVQSLS